MNRIVAILMLTAVAWMSALGQERAITGEVTNADDGSPIPGVNVVLKGTQLGTTTDRQGIYVLNVPATSGTLVFSFVGLKTMEVRIGASNIINVAMQLDVTQLHEVVTTRPAPRPKKD